MPHASARSGSLRESGAESPSIQTPLSLPERVPCGLRWGPADLTKPTSRPREKSAVAGPLCHELRHRSATHEKSLSLSLESPLDGLKMYQPLERLETNSGRTSLPKSGTRSQTAFRRGSAFPGDAPRAIPCVSRIQAAEVDYSGPYARPPACRPCQSLGIAFDLALLASAHR